MEKKEETQTLLSTEEKTMVPESEAKLAEGEIAFAEEAEEPTPPIGGVPTKKKKLTKKQLILIIIASVLIVAIVVAAVTVKFVMFNDPVYDVNLDAIRESNPDFVDEFDMFNEKVWTKEAYYDKAGQLSPRRGGYWAPDQVFTENGNLVIRTEKKDGKWLTGAVTSISKDATQDAEAIPGYLKKYGYFEVSCMLPKGYGIWSAFWMMSKEFGAINSKDASVSGSEIDIFEAPCWPNNYVQQAVHIGGYDPATHASTFNPRWNSIDKYDDLYNKYHTYGLYWDENIYKFYIDGICRWTTSYSNNVSKLPEYLLFSVEIGGENGNPNFNPWQWVGGKLIGKNPEGDAYTSDFKIDYVKVWNV